MKIISLVLSALLLIATGRRDEEVPVVTFYQEKWEKDSANSFDVWRMSLKLPHASNETRIYTIKWGLNTDFNWEHELIFPPGKTFLIEETLMTYNTTDSIDYIKLFRNDAEVPFKILMSRHNNRTESDFVYVYRCQYYSYKQFTDTFGFKPPDSLLLRNHPNFRPWSDSCSLILNSQ